MEVKKLMFVYIIGTLSRPDAIKEAALHYLNLGYSVAMVRSCPDISKEDLIIECFNKIDNCMFVVAVPHEDGEYGDGMQYEIAYAKKIGKHVVKWIGNQN